MLCYGLPEAPDALLDITVRHARASRYMPGAALRDGAAAALAEAEKAERLRTMQPYQVNAQLMSLAKPSAYFMHCLPAHPGEEVSAEVLESQQSIIFDQAENRLHVQKAILAHLAAHRG